MKTNAGFTLIELLVVVLIIGILASVALPQYETAVLKSRTMRLLPLVRSITEAQNVYFLANNTYSLDFTELDIEMPAGAKRSSATTVEYNDFWCQLRKGRLGDPQASVYCVDNRDNAPKLEKYFSSGLLICWGSRGDRSVSICKNISGRNESNVSSSTGELGFSF